MACTLHQILGWANQEDGMGEAYSADGGDDKYAQNFVWKIWGEETTRKTWA
jgi:hypothetical protein